MNKSIAAMDCVCKYIKSSHIKVTGRPWWTIWRNENNDAIFVSEYKFQRRHKSISRFA
jgi:hypothetical protein